jgi:type II secretory pathway pseudopilin PulG
MKKKTGSKNYRGITLVELMVVISIITIMSAAMLLVYSTSRGANKLQAAEREVATTIKLAHSYALQGRIENGQTPCGFGFRFKGSTTYEVFYNYNSGTDCATFNKTADNLKYSSNSTSATGDTYHLNPGVKLSDESLNKSVYFTVPHGGTFDSSGDPLNNNGSVSFNLKSELDNSTVEIKVGPGGLVTEGKIQ